MDAGAVDAGNAYEAQRARHIARNVEFMKRLGIAPPTAQPTGQATGKGAGDTPRRQTKRRRAQHAEPTRRSMRVRGTAPEVTAEQADEAADMDDDDYGDVIRGSSSKARGVDAVADAQVFLEAARAALNADYEAREREAGEDQALWHAEAVRRWGAAVPPLTSKGYDWQVYCKSRNTAPPPLTGELLQEHYAMDSYRLLVVCVLMSRVSSWDVKHKAVSSFFERFPTPSDVVAEGVTASAYLEVLKPLGLFPFRSKALLAVTEAFLRQPEFHVGLDPENKVFGLGPFGVENYRIFCRGDLHFKVTDETLKRYVKKQQRRPGPFA